MYLLNYYLFLFNLKEMILEILKKTKIRNKIMIWPYLLVL